MINWIRPRTRQANIMLEEIPERKFMDDPGIRWRYGKPDYSAVNKKYLKERTKHHKPGSLEKTVENIVKTFEMENTHKEKLEDWKTVDKDFWIQVNGGRIIKGEELINMGSYNAFLERSPFYDEKLYDQKESFDMFKAAFPEGFAWELLDVLSGPPQVTFTWRHWTKWTGPYLGQQPTGVDIEFRGVTIATVTEQLKIKSIQFFFDFNPILAKMGAVDKCPIAKL